MSITTKEDTLAGITGEPAAAGSATSTGAVQSPRRTDAVGVEVPVIVHASRNSITVKEIVRPQSPVHEETRTVIVFPQGAVVRLTATLTMGELVVLTNRNSGVDVLCRVASVKAQPGIQNYVDLEFTQRAPGFWGDCFPSQHSTAVPVAEPTPPQSSGAFGSLFNKPESLQLTSSPTFASASGSSPERQTVPAAPPTIVQVAAATLPATGTVPPAAPPMALATSDSTPSMSLTPPPDLQQPGLRSFNPAFDGQESASGSKKLVLITVAAVVLFGAIGGGIVLLRQERSAEISASQPAVMPQRLPAPPATLADSSPVSPPEDVASRRDVAAAPAGQDRAAATRVDARVSSRSPEREVVRSAEAAPAIAAKPKEPSRQSVDRVIAKLSAPVVKKASPVSSSEPPPLLPASATSGPAATSLLLNSEQSSGPVSPAVLARATPEGARREAPPKLISSPAPTYPPQATLQRLQGDVVVDALVDARGRVTEAKAISGSPLLQQAAINAVRTWKFEPARLNGQPVAAHTQVRLNFRLP